MDESKVAQDVGPVGVTDAYYWHGHLGAENVGHVEEISNMVGPCGWTCLVLVILGEERLTVIS